MMKQRVFEYIIAVYYNRKKVVVAYKAMQYWYLLSKSWIIYSTKTSYC
jgi:hypothetical protein